LALEAYPYVPQSCGWYFERLYRWFDGPEFLMLDQTQWPAVKRKEPDAEVVKMESRRTALAISTILEGVYKISSQSRCLSVVAWILRFADSFRRLKISILHHRPQMNCDACCIMLLGAYKRIISPRYLVGCKKESIFKGI